MRQTRIVKTKPRTTTCRETQEPRSTYPVRADPFLLNGAGQPVARSSSRSASSPVTYHGGWRWLRLPAQLCNSMSDCERPADAL